ncbi:MAG TPA: helix-turn-helix transcriptional regulator [Bryobacteraceae bacterium]|jgi:DNA-binding CsgD family transcriptional regulator|nr:helix-turn-helix transcriptional regulator [Bryobacteraceae bacterium]
MTTFLDRLWNEANRRLILAISGTSILLIALLDWWTHPHLALGLLYLVPIVLSAPYLPRWVVVCLGFSCAALSEAFSYLPPPFIRLSFEVAVIAGTGPFVGELVRIRRLGVEAQARLKALVETSPAAIMSVDERGVVELANRAAIDLLAPRDGRLVGTPVTAFLPDIHHAARWDGESPRLRASMACRAHRGNGETFSATVWFSTYKAGSKPLLAVILAEAAEADEEEVAVAAGPALALPHLHATEPQGKALLSGREAQVMGLLVQGLANKEIAARMAISESTVKNTFQQLFAKTGVRTRGQLVRIAMTRYQDEVGAGGQSKE